jgi:hypothetical protein
MAVRFRASLEARRTGRVFLVTDPPRGRPFAGQRNSPYLIKKDAFSAFYLNISFFTGNVHKKNQGFTPATSAPPEYDNSRKRYTTPKKALQRLDRIIQLMSRYYNT